MSLSLSPPSLQPISDLSWGNLKISRLNWRNRELFIIHIFKPSCSISTIPTFLLNSSFLSFHCFKTLVKDKDSLNGKSGADFYFIQEDGFTFKSTILYEPYFFIKCKVSSSLGQWWDLADIRIILSIFCFYREIQLTRFNSIQFNLI